MPPTAAQFPIIIHDHPRDEATWADTVSPPTLAALIDKMGEGRRLYFTALGHEHVVLVLKPDIARWMIVGESLVDHHGNGVCSRGTSVARGLARMHRAVTDSTPMPADVPLRSVDEDFRLIEISLVPVDQLVYPHPVGRIMCNECKGSGQLPPLFILPRECDACEGTGWMGGKLKSSSESNHETETGPGKTPLSESGKGDS